MSEPEGGAPWWVYILRCADGTLYTGIAADVAKRAAAHNSGKGAKYTRGRRPVEVVYREAQPDQSAALRREYAIKRLTRAEKGKLIEKAGFAGGSCGCAGANCARAPGSKSLDLEDDGVTVR